MSNSTEIQLLSAKSIAQRLDCSLSQFYKDVKDGNFPPPDKKLWGESKRGYRWTLAAVEQFIRHCEASPTDESEEDNTPPFQKIDYLQILGTSKGRAA